MSDLKSCSKCGIHQAVSEFPKDTEKPDGHRAQCKNCVAASKRKSYLKTQYGIEEDWVDLTYDQQNGCCSYGFFLDHVRCLSNPLFDSEGKYLSVLKWGTEVPCRCSPMERFE